IDEKGADEHEQPADPEQTLQNEPSDGTIDIPNYASHRPPLPEQQGQGQTGNEHVSAALNRLGNNSRPPFLEALPRHPTVLHGKQTEQHGIDEERRPQVSFWAAIDRLGNNQVAHESNRIQKSR